MNLQHGATVAILLGLAVGSGRAQEPVRVALGFGVDTTSSPNQEVFRLWRSYLAGPPNCEEPSPLWSAAEREKWPLPDLLCPYVNQGFTKFTIVQLAPAVGMDTTYLVRTLVSRVAQPDQDVQPLALYRVYVTREAGRWVLGNALPRLTRHWRREVVGRVAFVFPPTRSFARERAEGTARFVDSLATAFSVAPPGTIEYVFTDDFTETLAAAGLDFFPTATDTVGGRGQPANRLVLVGSSANGEGYHHEVAHVVLGPFLEPLKPAGLVVEGLMTWTGGSAGLPFSELMPGLRRHLESHPELTLESILSDPPPRRGSLDVGYAGAAVLCLMVHEAAGLPGLRALANTGPEPIEVIRSAAQVLRVHEGRLDQVWRNRIRELALRAGRR